MKQNIEIRKLKRRDTKELSRLLRRQEGYDEFFTEEKDADILARAAAERSLTFAYGEAAFLDGQMIGAVVGGKRKKRSIFSKIREKMYYIRPKKKKGNEDALKCLTELEKMEAEMLEKNEIPPSNLMSLFIIIHRYQKTMISESLLNNWENYIKKQKK